LYLLYNRNGKLNLNKGPKSKLKQPGGLYLNDFIFFTGLIKIQKYKYKKLAEPMAVTLIVSYYIGSNFSRS